MIKNKKGFTLVELLSTIAILAIVLGIASAAYIGITKYIKSSYYKTLEESILVSGGEYYTYTKERPEMFGDEKKISLRYLVENKYLTDIVDRKGDQCNLDTSYVGAYKDNYDKTNYYVCLTCDGDNYKSDKTECSGNIDYSLQMIATVNNKIYQSNSWVNNNVKLSFKTLNNINTIYVKDNSLGTSYNCTMSGDNIKTCSINIDKSGNYEYYGVSNDNKETKHGYINILVDKIKPSFDIYEGTTEITSDTIAKNINSDSISINYVVKNIVDLDSKVQSIRYSFEKEGSNKNYITIDNNLTEFNINKTLGLGKYELIIEIKDYAGNINKRTIVYQDNVYYCANFYLNGASEIDGLASNKTNVCCNPGDNTSCNITSPTITPVTNFEVLGWGNSENSTTIVADASGDITLTNDTNFYAITVSVDDTIKTYNVEFNLNGADSYNFQGMTYTEFTTFICESEHVYNGDNITTTCTLTLPTITRTGGTTYGWDIDDTKKTTPLYSEGQTITISDDLILYAITSRTINLSYDGNGGTTTLPNQTAEVYNDDEGAWFDIPAYDYNNMWRYKSNNFVGYKYSGLATSSDSSIVTHCQGNKIFATEDTTLYALWKTVYRTASHSVSSGLRVRASTTTSSTHLCTIPKGKKVYLTGNLTSCINTHKWYPVIYGSCKGYSSAGKNCAVANFTLDAAVKNSWEYTDYYCSGTNYNLTLTPKTITLNHYDGSTTAKITIEDQCGGVSSATSSDPSIVTVNTSGNVTAVSGGVAEGESKTATLTFTTHAGCSDTVVVTVKNINEVPPTVNISIRGETYSSGYKSGAIATVTCESSEGIASYTAKDNTGNTGTWVTNTDNTKVKNITLSSASSSRKIKVSCTSTNGQTASTSKTVKIYVYSKSSVCGVSSYSYSGTCKCKISGMGLVQPSCNSSIYAQGGCQAWCRNQAGSIPLDINSGSCTRSTNYKSCYHT